MIIYRVKVPIGTIIDKAIALNKTVNPKNELKLDAVKFNQVEQTIIIYLTEVPFQEKDKQV